MCASYLCKVAHNQGLNGNYLFVFTNKDKVAHILPLQIPHKSEPVDDIRVIVFLFFFLYWSTTHSREVLNLYMFLRMITIIKDNRMWKVGFSFVWFFTIFTMYMGLHLKTCKHFLWISRQVRINDGEGWMLWFGFYFWRDVWWGWFFDHVWKSNM